MAGQLVFGWLVDVSFIGLLITAGALLLMGAVAGSLLPHEPSGTQLSGRIEDLEAVGNEDAPEVVQGTEVTLSPIMPQLLMGP